MLKAIVLTTALLASTVLAMPTGYAKAAPASANQNVLKLVIESDPVSLDPGLAEDQKSGNFVRALFDGLTRTGTDGKVHPSMAEKIDVSADLKTYTFHLREAKWSNGERVTAHDFEYAWKRVIDPKTGSLYAYQMYYIKNAEKANKGESPLADVGVKAVDDKTLVVTLENPTPFFLELTAFYTYYPVNKKVVQANPEWAKEPKTLVGNGPFTLASRKAQESLVFQKNKNYWDNQAVKIDGINVTYEKDPNQEYALFDKGEVDWLGAPTGELTYDAIFALKEKNQLRWAPIAGIYWYKFNVEQPPFTNAKIRKAFAYAVNRERIAEDIMNGLRPATAVLPPTMELKPGGYFTDNDVAQAKKLLADGMKELGISKLPPITISYNQSIGHEIIAKEIQREWKEALGVEVRLEPKEWKQLLTDMHTGDFQIARNGWLADFNDPINILELFKDKQNGNNDTNWENSKYKDLLNQSAMESDPVKRNQYLAKAEEILMDEMPVLPIYYYGAAWAQSDRVSYVIVDGLGNVDYKWAVLKK